MTLRIFIPRDAGALAVGADEVAAAIEQRGARGAVSTIEIVRTGSRGLYWLEPMVEVAIAGGPHRLRAGDSQAMPTGLLDAGGDRRARIRCTSVWPTTSPGSSGRRGSPSRAAASSIRARSTTIARMAATRAWSARSRSAPAAIVEEVVQSGLRGRGGAGFPTGIKWRTVAQTQAPQKYIVCNADEGDSGTFADRMIMEGDPFVLIEGMAIAGFAVGATKGYVYIRSEYPHAVAAMEAAIAGGAARRHARPAGRGFRSRVRHRGAGRRRRLCLRRGDVAARKPRGQARHRARQAAAAGASRACSASRR